MELGKVWMDNVNEKVEFRVDYGTWNSQNG